MSHGLLLYGNLIIIMWFHMVQCFVALFLVEGFFQTSGEMSKVKIQVHADNFVLFWSNHWQLGDSDLPPREHFVRLFSYVVDVKMSVKEVMDSEELSTLFHLSLSTHAYVEFQQLVALLTDVNLSSKTHDVWRWPTPSGEYRNFFTIKWPLIILWLILFLNGFGDVHAH